MAIEPAIEHLRGVGSSARERDVAVAALAKRQHGVVARRQLSELGLSRRAITGRLQRGHLHQVFLGVYVVGARRISRKGQWMAAVLAAGEGALLSHRSAARFWRLMPPAAERVDVTCAPGRVVRRRGIVAHESLVADDEREVVDGVPVTSPFRTIFDLAAVASMRELLGSDAPVGITRNDFEEAFLALVDACGLSRPRMNADLSLRGRFIEVDALWERQRFAVELDSRGVHGTKKRFETDRHRDRVLVAEGWKTMRVTWLQLRDEPNEIAADLRLALGQPAPALYPWRRGTRAVRGLSAR